MMRYEEAEKLARFGSATLFEAMAEVQALGPAISPLYRPIQLWGEAYTVLASTGDNAAIHQAVSKAPAGSVLVVATGQDTARGYWGEVLMEAALARRIRGLVIDGGVRDTQVLRERCFPVFCATTAIRGTSKTRAGVLGQPVLITEVLIRPGDFVIGDDDGVAIVRSEDGTAVLEAAAARVEKEANIIEKLRQGELTINLFNLKRDS